jgi:hypothetical protein
MSLPLRTRRDPPTLVLDATTPVAPPRWALLQRRLIEVQGAAVAEFHARYFDDRGFLKCVPRWSGDDGPDDALENVLNWTVLHALGADDAIIGLYKHALEGHFQQYTEARTKDVAIGRDGMYYQDFHACFDWFHHGEAWSPVFMQGLSDPNDRMLTARMRRWTGWYAGENPHVPNYDKTHKVIRSFFNGSRGPMLRQATALDWAGDPIEIEGRFDGALHGETSYDEMLEHFRDYTDVVGDNHVNLGATTLGLTAFALTGETRWRDWVIEYLDAWLARADRNGGLIPSSVGPDGTVETGYGWYGGVYGWGFSVMQIPWKGRVAHRAYHTRTPYSLANGLLLSGGTQYVSGFRRMIDIVNANARTTDGHTEYPHMYGRLDRLERIERGQSLAGLPAHGPEGWYEYRPRPFAPSALPVWFWTHDRTVLKLLDETPRWVRFLDGDDPTYAEDALAADLDAVRKKVDGFRSDAKSTDTTMSDDMNHNNPATVSALIQLTTGGLPTGRDVHALHCRLRYFDPERRRAGLPRDVAALVETFDAESVTVTFVNVSPIETRTVIVQGGAYNEHRLISVTVADVEGGEANEAVSTGNAPFAVRLAPGVGTRLRIAMVRYANAPTFAFPWI